MRSGKTENPNQNVSNDFKASARHRAELTATSAEVVTTSNKIKCAPCALSNSRLACYAIVLRTLCPGKQKKKRVQGSCMLPIPASPLQAHHNTIWHSWPTYKHWGRGVLRLRERHYWSQQHTRPRVYWGQQWLQILQNYKRGSVSSGICGCIEVTRLGGDEVGKLV